MKVELHDLYIDALFHVIDADTSFNALLGQPWLYTSKAIASTLHQCLKYTNKHGNEKMVQGDANPFHGEDVNFADAKFYKLVNLEVRQVPLVPDGKDQKGNAKTPNLPQKIIRVVNSYVNEVKEPQPAIKGVVQIYT